MLSVVLGVVVRRNELRCIDFQKIRKEGTFGLERLNASLGSPPITHEFVMLTSYQVCLCICCAYCYNPSFYSGPEKPSKLKNDPDYVPSIFVFSSTTSANSTGAKVSRCKRLMQRREHQYLLSNKTKEGGSVMSSHTNQGIASECSHDGQVMLTIMDEAHEQHDDIQGVALETSSQSHNTEISETISEFYDRDSIPAEEMSTEHYLFAESQDKNVNTDIDSESWHSMEQTIQSQQEMITMLTTNLKVAMLSHAQKLENDDKQTQFYTGLASYALFDSLSNLLSGVFKKNPNVNHRTISTKDQFLLVLMKLRMGVLNKDLAYRFGISPGRVSQLFHEWIDVMSRELKPLIVWPDRQ